MNRMLARLLGLVFALKLLALPSAPAWSQTIKEAVEAYNADKYEEAAFLFAQVVERSDLPDDRVRAEYLLGHSLFRAQYYLAAYQYYLEVFVQGDVHPYFVKATQGLLNVAQELGDDVFIPEVIYRDYSEQFRQLDNDEINAINFMIGKILQRRELYRDASEYLKAVGQGTEDFLKAQYLLGVMSLTIARNQQAETFEETLAYFSAVEDELEEAKQDELKKLYRLALLAKARTYYTQGEYGKSVEYYEKVPRFSDDWYDAMFESGWAYRQNAYSQTTKSEFSREIGKALGMVHSIQSPYFDGRYRAESFVLKATAYFDMCHFDRVRKTLEDFFGVYEPMAEALKPFVEGEQTDAEMVDLIVNGAPGFPSEIQTRLVANRRFQKYFAQVERARAEIERAKSSLPDGAFKSELIAVLRTQLEQRVGLSGRLARGLVATEAAFLDNFINQARIIKFETADVETKLLQANVDLDKGPRARGPRPTIPNARTQFWAFDGEYWIDELGYYQHSIRNECIEAVYN